MQTSIKEYKGLNMKQVLKIILITFLCTIGGVALFIGGAYLLGFLDEKIVYAEDLSFNQTEIISATTFSMRVDTSTEGVTRKEVTLMASPGGEDVINFPKTVNIGEDFYISPRTNSKNQNVGGVVELYCKYEDKKANQNAVATCKILIDVNVESCSVKLDTDQYQLGNNILLANIGTKIDNMLDVSPSNALKPYIDKSNIETETADSLFYKENFKDKKIFITLPSNAKFVINGVETGLNILELPYEYKYSELDKKYDLYVTKKIEIKPQQGELTVSCYACPTYKNQDNVTEETLRDKDKLANLKVVVGNFDILVKNYTVGSMSTNESKTIDIY